MLGIKGVVTICGFYTILTKGDKGVKSRDKGKGIWASRGSKLGKYMGKTNEN